MTIYVKDCDECLQPMWEDLLNDEGICENCQLHKDSGGCCLNLLPISLQSV